MTRKEIAKKANSIIEDVINGKVKLDEKGLKELKALLLELKSTASSHSEKIDLAFAEGFANQFEKQLQKETFNKLSLKDKAKALNEQLDTLEKLEAFQKLPKQQAEKKEQEDFEKLYAEHVKKFGNDLDLNFNDRDLEADSQISDEDKAFYDEYAKEFGTTL